MLARERKRSPHPSRSLDKTLTIPVVPRVTEFQEELSALLVNLRIMEDHGDD